MDTDTESPKIQKVRKYRKSKNTENPKIQLVGRLYSPTQAPGLQRCLLRNPRLTRPGLVPQRGLLRTGNEPFYGRPPLDILSRFLALFSTSAFLFVLPQTLFRRCKTALLKQHKGLLRESMQHQLAQCPVMFIKFSRHSSFPAFA